MIEISHMTLHMPAASKGAISTSCAKGSSSIIYIPVFYQFVVRNGVKRQSCKEGAYC